MRKSPAIWLLALMLLVAMVMVLNFSACAKQTESYTAQGVMERPSQNFTAAVYDSQSRTLYCGELDT